MKDKSPELKVAIEAALSAGKILEKYFEKDILKELKEDTSIVTIADKESEQVIKKIISTNFPTHSILGEETGLTQNGGDFTWHIDPVDGTRNFSNGIPIFCVSIALEKNGGLFLGVIYNPITRSLFFAEKGKGAYLNENKISVSKDDIHHSIVTVSPGTGDGAKELLLELYYNLPKVVRSVRNLACTAMELAYIARGGLEANIQLGLNTYDFAAGVLLVQEAGGMVTDLDGGKWNFPENRFIVSNGLFHNRLVEELRRQKEKLGII